MAYDLQMVKVHFDNKSPISLMVEELRDRFDNSTFSGGNSTIERSFNFTSICHRNYTTANRSDINVALRYLTVTNTSHEIANCAPTISSNILHTSNEPYNTTKLCKDQFTVIYVNGTADYESSQFNCQKMKGEIISERDLQVFKEEIENIDENCDSDGIKSWIQTNESVALDSWCKVLRVNGSLMLKPCYKPLRCSLCKIRSSMEVSLFGEADIFERRYYVRVTQTGEIYLKGLKNTLVKKEELYWTMRSKFYESFCFSQDAVIPFVRLNWTCNSDKRLLALSLCQHSEFACDSGECVTLSGRCDGVQDCNDGSDEVNCIAFYTNPGYDKNELPLISSDEDSFSVFYEITPEVNDDIKLSNFYFDLKIEMRLEWRDYRLAMLANNLKEKKVECSSLWIPKFSINDLSKYERSIHFPENYFESCVLSSNISFNDTKRHYDDPYMGKY